MSFKTQSTTPGVDDDDVTENDDAQQPRAFIAMVLMGLLWLGMAAPSSAQAWAAQQLFDMAKNGEISSGMWSRGTFDKKFKGGCGWSNADATYRVTNLGMKLESLAYSANHGLGDAEIYNRAEILAQEINKSTLYQRCFSHMVQYDFRKPKSWFESPQHPYGQSY